MRNRPFLWSLGLIALALPTYTSMAAPWPRLWSPCSFILWVLWWRQPQGWWPYAVGPVAFAALTAVTLVGGHLGKYVLLVTIAATALLSLWWYSASFRYGIQYQGAPHTIGLSVINVSLVAIGVAALYRVRDQTSKSWQLTSAWLFVAWLVTYAFPYLGEFP